MEACGGRTDEAVGVRIDGRSQGASSDGNLDLTVIYTTRRATRAALEEADSLADDLDARIKLIVTDAVPYHASLTRGTAAAEVPCGLLRDLLTGLRSVVRVELYRCRDSRQALRDMLPAQSTILIGTGGFWSRRREQRLAAFLASLGHHVIEVPPAGGRSSVHETVLDVNEYG